MNSFDSTYTLEDKYMRESGRVYITGIQALVRLPMMQRQRDLAAGLNTAGFRPRARSEPQANEELSTSRGRR